MTLGLEQFPACGHSPSAPHDSPPPPNTHRRAHSMRATARFFLSFGQATFYDHHSWGCIFYTHAFLDQFIQFWTFWVILVVHGDNRMLYHFNKWYCFQSSKKQESSRKTSISALLTIPKPLTMWITMNCGKFWRRWEFQTTWPASWETCIHEA